MPAYTVILNGVTHVIGSVALRRYNPGLYTTLLLFFPWGIFQLVYFNGITSYSLLYNVVCLLVGLVGHAFIVAYALRKRTNLESGSRRAPQATP